MTEQQLAILLLVVFILLGIFLVPKMSKQIEDITEIKVVCPKCGAPGIQQFYGIYGQMSTFECEYCDYIKEDVY